MKTIILQHQFIYTGDLILVNTKYPYRDEDTKCHLTPVNVSNKKVLLNRKVVKLLSELMSEFEGWKRIDAVSGWRSLYEQQEIYIQSLKDNGVTFTRKFVARPGHSEHQTGLAVDFALKQECTDFIRPDFPYNGICQIFRQKSNAFGFIERYLEGKESITEIAHEPWHFRYVGTPHAEIMAQFGFALEEYIEFLKRYRFSKNPYYYTEKNKKFAVSYLEANEMMDTQFEIANNLSYSVSGNNIDGFIITMWREKNGR